MRGRPGDSRVGQDPDGIEVGERADHQVAVWFRNRSRVWE
jgi:hypothetical protein